MALEMGLPIVFNFHIQNNNYVVNEKCLCEYSKEHSGGRIGIGIHIEKNGKSIGYFTNLTYLGRQGDESDTEIETVLQAWINSDQKHWHKALAKDLFDWLVK